MRHHYVVDTNVLIAASAGDPQNPAHIDATPEDPKLRFKVWLWLCDFQESGAHLVLDDGGAILDEYERNLGFNDFGLQMLMHKWSTLAVDNVPLAAYGDRLLPDSLDAVVHDQADKKMVAAALAALDRFGDACVAFAGDTDWHDWEDALKAHSIALEALIEEWSRKKHAEKKKNKHSQGRGTAVKH